jgi:mutual gliding-motility protein MglA
MATINFALREITAKVVYFGATGAGCTTNVEQLHANLDGRRKGELHGFGPEQPAERSWFFQYAIDGPIAGFDLVVRTYALPGGIEIAAHREEVARDVDAVVLVADARRDRNPANTEALLAMEEVLQRTGRELSQLPVVIQVNHTDAPDARAVADVIFDLNPLGFQVFEAVAREGRGVRETHEAIVEALRARIRNAVTAQTPAAFLVAVHDPTTPDDVGLVAEHVRVIRHRAPVSETVGATPARRQVEDGPEIEIPFQPRELVGSHPIQVVSAAVAGDRIRVELVMERMGGAEARRLVVWLANRPADAERRLPRAPMPPAPTPAPARPRAESSDLPPIWYGTVGVVGGIVIGGLLAYLAGALV